MKEAEKRRKQVWEEEYKKANEEHDNSVRLSKLSEARRCARGKRVRGKEEELCCESESGGERKRGKKTKKARHCNEYGKVLSSSVETDLPHQCGNGDIRASTSLSSVLSWILRPLSHIEFDE